MNIQGNENVKRLMNEIFDTYASKEAITYMKDDGTKAYYSFSDIFNMVKHWEKCFEKCGLQSGDRVAIVAPHTPKSLIASMALIYTNITTVMLDPALPKEEIQRLLEFSDVQGVFTVDKIYSHFEDCLISSMPVFDIEHSEDSLLLFNDCSETVQCTPVENRYEDVMVMLFSSGTTNTMKGIMLTYDSVVEAKNKFVRNSGLKPYMTYLIVFPLNHISGYVSAMIYLLAGCGLGMIENVDSTKLQKGLQEYNPYCFGMVPKVYDIMADKVRQAIHEKGVVVESLVNMMLAISKFFRKKLGIKIGRVFFKPIYSKVFGKNIYGLAILGTTCKPETAELFLNFGLEWANIYATTETNTPIACTGIFDRYPVNSVGNVKRNTDIDIVIHNPDANGIGEIYVKTPLIMKGYFRDAEMTANAFDNDYFKTGDLGYVDRQGYLYIVGRSKDTIILHNGKKVSAADIDDFYQKVCPNVMLASCGIQNAEGYDEVFMFIETQGLSESEIQNSVHLVSEKSSQTSSLYKIKHIFTIEKIPVTSVGKVKRYLLKEHIKNHTYEKDTTEKTITDEKKSNEDIVIEIIKSFHLADGISVNNSSKLVDDLQFDSLSIFELCVELDKRFGVSLESSLHENITVGEIVQYIDGGSIDSKASYNDAANYPLERTTKDYKNFERFIRISKFIWKFDVSGKENIEGNENYIFCPNHESHFDGMWVIGNLDDRIKHSICSIAADYLFEKKIYRKGVIFMGGIPVHRSGNTSTALKRAYECITSENYSLLIHPEGTRTRNGELGEFKLGAAKLSVDTGLKIIPVCINGAYEIFPPHRRLPHLFDWKHFRRYTLQIKFGKPIAPKGKNTEAITEEIRNQIVAMKQEQKWMK